MVGSPSWSTRALCEAVLDAALRTGTTLGVAESLTGGLVTAALVGVPGASDVLRGGVTAYATDLKASVLGVDAALLGRAGPVHPDVARQMAEGVARVTGATCGLATTGVAGPGPQDGTPAGTVHVAVWTQGRVAARALSILGDRTAIRGATVDAVLALTLEVLREQTGVVDR